MKNVGLKKARTKTLSAVFLNIIGKCHIWIPILQLLAIMMNYWVVLCFGVPSLKGLSWQLCFIFTLINYVIKLSFLLQCSVDLS